MKRIIESVFSLVSSSTCVVCERVIAFGNVAICHRCLGLLERTYFEQIPQGNPLYAFFHPLYGIRSAWALFYFDKKGLLQKAIHALKYHGRKDVGITLGNYVGKMLLRHPFYQPLSFTLVPVPLHRKKLQKRGYNQSEWIAKGIAQRTGFSVSPHLLQRTRYTQTQTRLNREERLHNVKGAIQLRQRIENEELILVDDLVTTGATLMACLDALGDLCQKTHIITLAIPRNL
jgi:ComF family protein